MCMRCSATVDSSAQLLAGLPTIAGHVGGGGRSVRPVLNVLGALLDTLEHLLTAPFPTPVAVPAAGMLGLATRILDIDDAPTGVFHPEFQ